MERQTPPPEDFFGAPAPKRLSREQKTAILRAQILPLAQAANSSRKIGEILGIAASVVYYHVRSMDAPRARPGPPIGTGKGLKNPERLAFIRAGVEAKRTDADMARDLGISRERVRQIVKRLGLLNQKKQNALERRDALYAGRLEKFEATRRGIKAKSQKLFAARLARIRPLHEIGMTGKAIAKALSLGTSDVSRCLIRAGLRTHNRRTRAELAALPPRSDAIQGRRDARAAKRMLVLELWAAGRSKTAICEEARVSYTTCKRWCDGQTGGPQPPRSPRQPLYPEPPGIADWSLAENVATLEQLWADGHTAAAIGRRMNISKNAVIGKSHRLNLPSRPSPIRRDR